MPLSAFEGAARAPGLTTGVPEPQAVLGTLTTSAAFLVVSVAGGPEADRRVLEVVSDAGSWVRAVGFRHSEADLTCIVGLGSTYWDRVRPPGAPRPRHLHPLRAVRGARHAAPATPGDVLFHIRANRRDLVFELTRQLVAALGTDVEVEDHTVGFRYFDSRDLLGFVDGTENPTGRAAAEAAIVGVDDEPDFAGGSYVVVQRYLHDLDAWGSLTVEEQERIIGRTKLDDIELPDDVKPSSSHVSLNTIVDADGLERDILRDNMAFGDPAAGQYGTYYIAYASDPSVTELMLERMFVGAPAGNYDRILDVSSAVTGTLFFVPSLELLESLSPAGSSASAQGQAGEAGEPAEAGEAAAAEAGKAAAGEAAAAEAGKAAAGEAAAAEPEHGAGSRPDDGQLGIGSLREDPPRRRPRAGT